MVLCRRCSILPCLLPQNGRNVARIVTVVGGRLAGVGGCLLGCVGALYRDGSTDVRQNQGPLDLICTQGYLGLLHSRWR